jgi:pimeloyl-ACP methyl ester carboxylesterase
VTRRGVRGAGPAGIDADVLVIWGERDPALSTRLLDDLPRVAPRVRIHRIPDAGHWVQNEAPALVNDLLVDFLARGCRPCSDGSPAG